MVLAHQTVHSLTTQCSSCTSAYNITSTPSIPKSDGETGMVWTNEDWNRYTVPYNIDMAVSTKNISIVRKPVSYQTVSRSNKFNKNSNRSQRRRGALFQPGRTNCNQRTIR